MGNKLEIGKVVSEKLNSLDKTPNNRVWEGIEMELNKKKKRPIAFFWIWFAPLFLIGTSVIFFNSIANDFDNSINNATINFNHTSDSSEIKTNKKRKIVDKNDTYLEIDSAKSIKENQRKSNYLKEITTANKKNKHRKNKFSDIKNSKTWKSSTKKYNLNNKNESIVKIDTLENNSVVYSESNLSNSIKANDSISLDSKLKILDSIKKDKKIKLLTKNITKEDSLKSFKNWEVDTYLSPTIYNTFSNKSTLDSRLDGASKKSEITSSYGLGLNVNITEKIAVRLGFEMTNFSLTTSNAEINTADYLHIDYTENTSNQTLFTDSNNAQRMNIKQNLSYSRIPLEVRYTFIPAKIGITGFGGFSYLFLSKNEVWIETDTNFSKEIGKTGNLVEMGLSANIGIGIDYKLNKRLRIIIEPIFDYQVRAFENNSAVKPYSFTIRTGLRYKLNK